MTTYALGRMDSIQEVQKASRFIWPLFIYFVFLNYIKLYSKIINGRTSRLLKAQLALMAAMRNILLQRGVLLNQADRHIYNVALAFSMHMNEKAFGKAARYSDIKGINQSLWVAFTSFAKTQVVNDYFFDGKSVSYSIDHCSFMQAFRELGVPTETVGLAFCHADRVFWSKAFSERTKGQVIFIKGEETQATHPSCHCKSYIKEET